MPHLGINIDHVATVRQARSPKNPFAHNAEPLVLEAARQSIAAGAVGITVHLRADRRHIQDADVKNLRAEPGLRLNLEMGNTPEIVEIALQTRPDEACLVPENREEVTTEGGLDVVRLKTLLAPTVRRLTEAGTRVSMFIEPDAAQIDASLALGAHMVELHTGAFANAQGDAQLEELQRLIAAANHAHQAGLQVNAGHGINYTNIALIRQVPHLVDLNIGHSIIARSLFTGLPEAVREMIRLMNLPA
jgi:pyridoxine 5-phosphate synthase